MGRRTGRAGGDGEPELSRAQKARLDAALAEYRDRTYAEWSAPGGETDVSPLADRRIAAALRGAPSPARPRRLLRYGLTAGAAAVTVVAVTVALSTVEEPAAEPETDVLLAAATPGGQRGPFADGAALTRCLDAAAVPADRRTLLGAGPVDVRGDPATVLLLPGAALGDLRVLAVTPACAEGTASSVLVNRTLPGSRGRG
ncbi:hypothetical protein [Tsukamurella sp. PLM1]|uniref:hypothetical protein n=1 Tax=Tsukamurella sp. PLM1 TaxID=2929795 RepID=UPI0020606069|nr:hypothetical protein [Tsukamurella sp. PLM1]BDH59858.1 hypothetical protein MTP03_47970 [Tsukamurella sp. PLM1]